MASEFNLYEAVSAVLEVYDGIAFKVVLVSVVIYFPSKSLCIYSKISDAQCLEQQPESIEVVEKIFRTEAQSGCGNGRIGEITCIRSTYSGLAAEIGIPCERVFYYENLLQGFDVGIDSVFIDSWPGCPDCGRRTA